MMEIKLIKPLTLDGNKIEKIDLKLDELTGIEILKIDSELKTEGKRGFVDVNDQETLLMVASKASGLLKDDLAKLSAPDFLEVTFTVKNFLYGYLELTEEQKNSEESSLN